MTTKTVDGVALPASAFAYVPNPTDPSTWKLRIDDAGHVGGAAAALGPGYRGNEAQIPAADRAKVVSRVRAAWRKFHPGKADDDMPDGIRPSGRSDHSRASFAAATVRRRGKIFEAGDYPEKQFSATPDDLANAVRDFTPVKVRDTHFARETSLLDGQLGHLVSVEQGADPWDLIGEVELPQWLDDLLPREGIPVSAEWNRETRRLEGLALVTNPEIEEAVLFAAFAKATHNTPQGQSVMQQLHDAAAGAGAVCNDPARFASKHEATATQQIHDITVEHGATCASGDRPRWFAHVDTPVEATGALFSSPRRSNRMSKWGSALKSWITGGMQGDPPEPEPEVPAIVPFASATAMPGGVVTTLASSGPNPEVEALKAEVGRLKAARIEQGAAAFFATQYAAHRVVPAERDAVLDEYRRAAIDDAEHGLATFAGGVQESRVDALAKRYSVKPAHMLTRETENLSPEQLAQFMQNPLTNPMTTPGATQASATPMTDAQRQELLALTPLGRSSAARNGAHRN